MRNHHEVGAFEIAATTDGDFRAQAFFCHSDQARATTSINAFAVQMNGWTVTFLRNSHTRGDPHDTVPAISKEGSNIFADIWDASTPTTDSDATDIKVNGQRVSC